VITKTATININTNAKEAQAEIQNLSNTTDQLGGNTSNATAALNGHTAALKTNANSILENGGAMGLLNDLTGGYAMMVKDAVEASALFITGKKADTAATNIMTVSTVSNNTANQSAILTKIKDTASTVASTVAKGIATAATTVATAAQWLWNAAVLANPLVAFIALLVAAGTGIYLFTKYLIDSSAANDEAAAKTAKNTIALEQQSVKAARSANALKTHNEHVYAMAAAAGASSEELRKLTLKHIAEEIALNKTNATLASNTFIRERNTLASLKSAGAADEVIAAQEKLTQSAYKELQEQNNILDKSYKNRAATVRSNEVAITAEKTSANHKANDDLKAANDKAASEAKATRAKELSEIKTINDAAKAANELALLTDKDKETKILTDKYNENKKALEKYGADTNALEIKYLNDKNDINLKYQEAQRVAKEAIDKAAADKILTDNSTIDSLLAGAMSEKTFNDAKNAQEVTDIELYNNNKLEAQRLADVRKMELAGATAEQIKSLNAGYTERENANATEAADKRAEIEKIKYSSIKDMAGQGMATLDSLEKLGLVKGKAAKKLQKALTLTQIGADTASAISSLVKGSEATGAAAGPAYLPTKIATYAAGIIPILANIAKAKQLLSSGDGDSGGGGSSVSAAATAAPSVAFQNSPQSQISDSIKLASEKNTVVKAFVVSTDITKAQQLDRQISDSAKF